MIKAKENFTFYSRLHLIELTGIKSYSIPELLENIKIVNGSCIYHHTHHFIQKHQYLAPEPTSDFAYWVTESLGDKQLGEELASIDILSHHSIRSIREALIIIIENALKKRPKLKLLFAPEGEEFSFLKSLSFIFPTNTKADDLESFAECIKTISINSIYFHLFESKLRLEKSTNDFSNWLLNSLHEKQLALKFAQLDPYTITGENLRQTMLNLINKRLLETRGNND